MPHTPGRVVAACPRLSSRAHFTLSSKSHSPLVSGRVGEVGWQTVRFTLTTAGSFLVHLTWGETTHSPLLQSYKGEMCMLSWAEVLSTMRNREAFKNVVLECGGHSTF